MIAHTLSNVYKNALKLNYHDKILLISKLTLSLQDQQVKKRHKLSELKGLGKEIWTNIDVTDYLQQLRGEWDD